MTVDRIAPRPPAPASPKNNPFFFPSAGGQNQPVKAVQNQPESEVNKFIAEQARLLGL